MNEVVRDKRIILFYIAMMLMTYLLVVRVDSINDNIANNDLRIVYNG